MGWTSEQQETISTLTEVSSWATLAGTSFILLSYLIFKEIRHFQMRLIFFLAIADFTTSIVFILNLHVDISHPVTCDILAGGLQYSELCSTIWAMCIAFVLDQVIRASNFHVERYEKIFHILAWCIPAISVVGAYFQGLFSNTGLWCWIANTHHGLYRWVYFYGPLVMILFYVVAVYVLVSRKIRSEMYLSEHSISAEATIQQTFRWYIIGWAICWVPAIVDRLQGVVDPLNPNFVLTALHSFFTPLAGFCNSIAIGFNDEIQSQYMDLFWRWGVRFKFTPPRRLMVPEFASTPETKQIQESLLEYDYGALDDSDMHVH
jgi:hypothetical protein